MSKEEIKAKLKAEGTFDTNGKTPTWISAFELYYKETKRKLSVGCGGCYRELRNWMNK